MSRRVLVRAMSPRNASQARCTTRKGRKGEKRVRPHLISCSSLEPDPSHQSRKETWPSADIASSSHSFSPQRSPRLPAEVSSSPGDLPSYHSCCAPSNIPSPESSASICFDNNSSSQVIIALHQPRPRAPSRTISRRTGVYCVRFLGTAAA